MSKVLVAVDGSGHAGLATAYLINRARDSQREDLLVVTVDRAEPVTVRAPSPLADLTATHTGAVRAIADAAGPWLEDAGIDCEFRGETGDVAEVVGGLTRHGSFQEVVLVSEAPTPLAGVLACFQWYRRGMALYRLRATTSLPVSLIASQTARWHHQP